MDFFEKGESSWGRGKLLFTGKEVFPFPKPHPFSRYYERHKRSLIFYA